MLGGIVLLEYVSVSQVACFAPPSAGLFFTYLPVLNMVYTFPT